VSGDETEPDAVRPLSGVDLARAALAQARAQAKERGTARRRAGGASGSRGAASRGGRGREPGDPEPVGRAVERLLAERGWHETTAVAGVTERWPEIAGEDLASHCRPERFADGVLTLVAESTAWATQVRLLRPALHRRIADVVGEGVVTSIEVHGPTRPDWRKGPLRVPGRGPGDTYG
jgi:predicted nucleic acid-binding Zn ribbon protein